MKLSLHSRAQKEMKKHEGSLPAGLAPPERLREGDAGRHACRQAGMRQLNIEKLQIHEII